jgi:hypothetical protein
VPRDRHTHPPQASARGTTSAAREGGFCMPKAQSKAQQRKLFVLARRGKISMATAKKHARKGKAFKALPARKRKRK